MSIVTPVPPPQAFQVPSPVATPVEPPKKGHTLLWLVLFGLTVLLAIGVGAFVLVFLTRGDDGAAIVNEHSAQVGEPVFVEVPGYEYTDPSFNDVAEWDDIWTQANEEIASQMPARFSDTPYFTSWSLHDVNRATEGRDFLGLALVEINPKLVGLPGFDPDMVVTQWAGGMAVEGTTVTTETIDGETVAVATTPEDDLLTFVWYHEGTINTAAGEDERAVRAFAEAYITEQNG